MGCGSSSSNDPTSSNKANQSIQPQDDPDNDELNLLYNGKLKSRLRKVAEKYYF